MAVAQAAPLSLSVEMTPQGDVFPALELSQAKAGSADEALAGNGLLRVHVGHTGPPRMVRLTLSTPGLLAPTVIDTRVDADTLLRPRLQWDVATLRTQRQVRTQRLRVTLSSPGIALLTHDMEIRVHPLDEALYFVREGNDRIDLGWSFAAWVDPEHPVIDQLLALADTQVATNRPLPLDRAGRIRLARSIWVALERRGLRYADESAGISQGPVIYSQRVRLLSSIWDERVANCLDGSVLIASALERLGVRSFLVLVPGHAFVGFYTDDGRREAEFLETTVLGYNKPTRRARSAEDPEHLTARALAGFEAARKAGRARYRQVAQRLDGRHRPDYALIDISTARAYGIMPLAVGRSDSAREAPVALSAPSRPRRPSTHIP